MQARETERGEQGTAGDASRDREATSRPLRPSFRWRYWLVQWHRWFGLLAAVWLVAMGVTGSALVFYGEADLALNRDLHLVEPGGEMRPADEWVEAAEAALPGGHASFIDLPAGPDRSARVSVSALPGSEGTFPDGMGVYVDPYTLEVMGQRSFDEAGLGRRGIMNLLYRLHIDLYLGDWMMWFLGLVALFWIADHVVSAILSFPVLKKWAASFRIRRGVSGHKRVFDLHRASGLWFLPVTFVVAVSGLYFNWYETVVHTVDAVSPVTERTIFTAPSREAPVFQAPVTFSGALASFDGQADMIRLVPSKGLYEARVYDERDIDPYGRRLVTVDALTGAVIDDRHQAEGSAGDVFLAWQYPLHSGKAFGWPGRLVIFASGIVLTALCVTGVMIWWRKRRARRAKA